MRLAFRESGDPGAPPLVLLHDLTSDGTAWDEVAAHFAGSHRVLVPDLRGHGRSPHPGTYSFELMGDDVLAFVDERGLPQATFIGHSLGGVVAFLLAARHQGRVTSLVWRRPRRRFRSASPSPNARRVPSASTGRRGPRSYGSSTPPTPRGGQPRRRSRYPRW